MEGTPPRVRRAGVNAALHQIKATRKPRFRCSCGTTHDGRHVIDGEPVLSHRCADCCAPQHRRRRRAQRQHAEDVARYAAATGDQRAVAFAGLLREPAEHGDPCHDPRWKAWHAGGGYAAFREWLAGQPGYPPPVDQPLEEAF